MLTVTGEPAATRGFCNRGMTLANEPSLAVRIALLRAALSAAPSIAVKRALSRELFEAGESAESARLFQEAFLADPVSNPLRSLADSSATETMNRARSLIEHGAGYSPVIAELAIALAQAGRSGDVLALVNYDRFLRSSAMPDTSPTATPEFREELARTIRSDLTLYQEPVRQAIRHARRHDRILDLDLPVSRLLRDALTAAAQTYISGLPLDAAHPFLSTRPAQWTVEAWAVVSDHHSYHRSHIHPRAWMSGVYYVIRPPVSLDPDAKLGWLRVGAPDTIGRAAEHWPERWIEPAVGRVVMMPAYFFHDTRPTGVPQERICVAFDVVPSDIAESHAAAQR